jgi:predicted Rossmann fold flavoprotein
MSQRHAVIIGGGAAGFFAAITCAEASPATQVTLLEKGQQFLSKVRISGGGRCNVTHACFEPDRLITFYPRGGAALLRPFMIFQSSDTVEWFESRGVKLKTEPDGRMFPTTDSSQTVIDCLVGAARAAKVRLLNGVGVDGAKPLSSGGFELGLHNGETMVCDALMLATGGCRAMSAGKLATDLGHTLEPPVPSLFTFHLEAEWIKALAGISVTNVEVSVPGQDLTERGPILLTHQGLSGPAVLKISAWGARKLHRLNYRFPIHINWMGGGGSQEVITASLADLADRHPARFVVNTTLPQIPSRLWQSLVLQAGISGETRWASVNRSLRHRLIQQLFRTELHVVGKTLNQEEFVTCGGVRLGEVNFKTMESRKVPGLYFGGEILDIDGVTGGFNFQSAWTTGWIAGNSMAKFLSHK